MPVSGALSAVAVLAACFIIGAFKGFTPMETFAVMIDGLCHPLKWLLPRDKHGRLRSGKRG